MIGNDNSNEYLDIVRDTDLYISTLSHLGDLIHSQPGIPPPPPPSVTLFLLIPIKPNLVW